MDTLVALGSSASYVWSVYALFMIQSTTTIRSIDDNKVAEVTEDDPSQDIIVIRKKPINVNYYNLLD